MTKGAELPLTAAGTDLQAAWRVFIETATRLQTELDDDPVSYTHLTLPTNREV